MAVRLLLAVFLMVTLAGSARAEDFSGRKLDRQPTQFLFGYGSIINAASRDATAARPAPALPARIAASFGYVRAWNDRSPTGFTALGLRRVTAGEAGSTINGVLYPVEEDEMSAFDARETGYRRVEVPREEIEPVSWQAIPSQGRVWVYAPEGGAPPDAEYPLLQSYVDVVIEGGLEYGPDFAREIILTTEGWSAFWLNDRRVARRPWVFDRQYGAVDRLLSPHAPHFADRAFPETYAARFSSQQGPSTATR